MVQMRKCTMLIQQATTNGTTQAGGRVAGWSESFYLPADDSAFRIKTTALAIERAKTLTSRAEVYGVRFSLVNPRGRSAQIVNRVRGNQALTQDIPQMSVLVKAYSGDGGDNFRLTYFRGWNDLDVLNGELVNKVATAFKLNNFFIRLASDGWRFRGRDMAQPLRNILEIQPDGAVTMIDPMVGIAAGSYVQVLRTQLVDQVRRTQYGAFAIVGGTPAPTPSSFTLIGWQQKVATKFGQMRVADIVYPIFDLNNWTVERATTRRVGRPFDQYVGKRPTRR